MNEYYEYMHDNLRRIAGALPLMLKVLPNATDWGQSICTLSELQEDLDCFMHVAHGDIGMI